MMEVARNTLRVLLAIVVVLGSLVTGTPTIEHRTTLKQPPLTLQQLRSETLHDRYKVDWQANFLDKTIQFWIEAKTTGYVGFGLSLSGSMEGADMIIGGVNPDGSPYFGDYHGTGNAMPVLDTEKNWENMEITQKDGVTFLHLKRKLDTCDPHDIQISNGTIKLLWSLGEEDKIQYHGGHFRGALAVNMLTPPPAHTDLSMYSTFNITQKIPMTSDTDTLYWCSMHRRTTKQGKSHIVAFKPKMDTPEAKLYTHHFDVFRCKADPGEDPDEVFGKYIGGPGENCLHGKEGLNGIRRKCFFNMYAWSMGGRLLVMPDDIGLPWGLEENEYFWLEIHLDNRNLQQMEVETGLTVYHTDVIRPKEAGLLSLGMLTEPALMIPPATKNWTVAGHCSPSCTERGIPDDGFTLFSMNLHAHFSARKMKLHHFRDGKELPWIARDDTYDFDYQEYRTLAEPIKLLKGDQLTFECTYDSTWKKKPASVVGGLSSYDEMCTAFVFYYPAGPLERCFSSYPNPKLMERFGISQFMGPDAATFEGGDPFVIEPIKWKGRLFSDILNKEIKWNDTFKSELQQELRYGTHFDFCHTKDDDWQKNTEEFGEYNTAIGKLRKSKPPREVKYPVVKTEYEEPRDCAANDGGRRISMDSSLLFFVTSVAASLRLLLPQVF